MKECDHEIKLNYLIVRINLKPTWEETAIIEKLEGFSTFGIVGNEYGFEFLLLKSQVLLCVEITLFTIPK